MKKLLGPLCEGAPAAAGGGESLAAIRSISGCGKVQPLRPCGPPPLLGEARGGVTINFASPSYTRPAAPANCTPRQCGTARPEACSGHSAGVPAGLCGRRGRLKFQQTARGALHRTACPYSRSAGRTGSGRPADGSRPHRGPGRCRFASAGRVMRSASSKSPRRRRDRLPASVSYCL